MLYEFCSKTGFDLPLNDHVNQTEMALNSVQWHDLMMMAD
jgi:hypothetical protein